MGTACVLYVYLVDNLFGCFKCVLYAVRSSLHEATDSPIGSAGPGSAGSNNSATESSGSDTPRRSEFSQVKLHAHNQIVLSQVLSDERDQVLCVRTTVVCKSGITLTLVLLA